MVLVAAFLVLLGSAQAQRTAAGPGGKAIPPARAQAARSPVGLWRASSGRLYRWVAISVGFEEQFASTHTLKNSCTVRAGDAASRFYSTENDLYRAVDQVWRGVCVRRWCGRCTKHWEAAGMVKIAVSGDRMTVSCENKPEQVCETYTRAGG